MVTIKTLSGVSIESVYRAFADAFSDYTEPFQLSLPDWQHMIERRGYRAELSFGAFAENKIIGFTLNGVGEWNNLQTAYDTGTGVSRSYRQKGIAARIFNESLPTLQQYGIRQYLLEVIRTNHKAVDLYLKSGFKVTREFEYTLADKRRLHFRTEMLHDEFTIKEMTNEDWSLLSSFWDFQPSWQNSIAAIERKRKSFTFLGAYQGFLLVGYGLIERHTGDIPQIAVNRLFRRKGVATNLLYKLREYSSPETVKVINTWSESNLMNQFLKSIQFPPGPGQYEMIRDL